MQENKYAVAAAVASLVVVGTCTLTIRKLGNGEYRDCVHSLMMTTAIVFIFFNYQAYSLKYTYRV